jgi:hypothetical protein
MTQSHHVHVHRYDKHDTPHALGRHVVHDSRSRDFTFEVKGPTPERSVVWPHNTPVLNQGQLGSCTGNAMAQLLNCKLFAPCRLGKMSLDEADAVKIYSLGTHDDGGGPDQYYPPNDDGCSGLGVAKAAQSIGYINSYLHCFTLTQLQAAIQTQPVIVGTPWTEQMFTPDPTTGVVTVGAINDSTVQGGHEYLCQGIDFETATLIFLNSWGTSWGGGTGLKPGQFRISFADFTNLLAAEGDVVVPQSKKVVTA